MLDIDKGVSILQQYSEAILPLLSRSIMNNEQWPWPSSILHLIQSDAAFARWWHVLAFGDHSLMGGGKKLGYLVPTYIAFKSLPLGVGISVSNPISLPLSGSPQS